MRQGGFDLVSLANNHIRDCGEAGVLDTVAACEAAGLKTVGVGENAAHARVPVIAQAAGLKVGILAVAENEFGCAGRRRAGGNPFDPMTTPLAVRELSREADAVLVLLHGGVEGYRLPSPGMTHICRALVEAGASAVVCCHTHVPGGLEFHREAPIVYGTGNFFFQVPPGLSASDDFFVGYGVSLWIGRGGVRQLALTPYRQDSRRDTVEPLGEGDALGLMRQTLGLSAVIADEEVLAERWEEFCAANRVSTLAPALGLGRIERRLLRHGVWPFWRLPRRSVPALLNAIRCESHLERLTTTLTNEYEAVAKQASSDRRDSDDER